SGNCTGTGSCVVSMTAARSVTATFQQVFRLSVSMTGNGTVSSSPVGISCTTGNAGTCTADFLSGTQVSLTATPAAGSVFSGWSGSGISCPGTDPCPVTMDQARSVAATFVQQFALTLSGAGSGMGTVTSVPTGINCTSTAGTTSGSCAATYSSGVSVTLTATPVAGSAFSNWSRDCVGTGSCVVSMTAARSVTATFQASVQQFAL